MTYVASGSYFLFSRNLSRKQRWWRPHMVLGAVLFLGMMFAWGFPIVMIAPLAVFVGIMTAIQLRRPPPFCLNCGATVWPSGFLSKPAFCSRCGAALPQRTEPGASSSSTGRPNER
jgi:hypothetical protein